MNKYFRFTSVAVSAALCIFLFYGNIIKSLNKTYFAQSGDGLYTYMGAQYYIKHDTTLLKTRMLGYPYDELVLFSSNLPVFSNSIKFVSNNLIDISDYTIGIINFLMLFSLFLSALFLYLIFRHLKLPFIVSWIAGISIAFLTPELDRFGGHFALSFVLFIPLMIFMLFKFYDAPSLIKTFVIFLIVLIASLTHFYYYGFFSIMFIFFWLNEIIINKNKTTGNWKKSVIHLFIQWILPFLLIRSLYIFDAVTDRTSHPWGFMYYRAYPHSVLLPANRWYGHFFHNVLNYKYIDWEGFHFVGLVASIAFFIFIFLFIKKLIYKKYGSLWKVTKHHLLNVLFWSSVLALLYCWGIPFIFGLEGLLEYLGPVRQMRGIARFAWVFFYIMNIAAVYQLWHWKMKNKSLAKNIIAIMVLLFLTYDSWLNVRHRQYSINNKIPELSDIHNILPENNWVKSINSGDYQAIIPLPYFHVGSENIWITCSTCEVVKPMLTTTFKTSIPNMGVVGSRYSIGRTYKQYGLFTEPYRYPEILNDFKNKKDLLICKVNGGILTPNEERFLDYAEKVGSGNDFELYRLKFESLYGIFDSIYYKKLNGIDTTKMYPFSSFWYDKPVNDFNYVNFDENLNPLAYSGNGSITAEAKKGLVVFDDTLQSFDTSLIYTVSFWFGNITSDLYGRTKVEYQCIDTSGVLYNTEWIMTGNRIKIIDKSWALIEHNFKLKSPKDRLKIIISNKDLRKKKLTVDELLIIPSGKNLIKMEDSLLYINNRFYYKNQK